MKWELDRHNWAELGEDRASLTEWIVELVETEDPERANRLLSLIESAVVPVNGPMRVGAVAVAACLVQGLMSANSVSRNEILYLLFQLAGGVVDVPESDLVRAVRREVELGLPIYSVIAETGSFAERIQCVDLLSLCARFNADCLDRAVSVMRRIAEFGEVAARAVSVEFADLSDSGYIS